MKLTAIRNAFLRRKRIVPGENSSKLQRYLNTFDLTALGIGSTLGLGMYVTAGKVASTTAGPAVIISFFIAAFASVLAGFCYAEFGARVPRAGSAYVYSYVTVGEFIAFVIGWNLILEYIIGTASVARGYSNYIDKLVNDTIKNTLQDKLALSIPGVETYPDMLALAMTLTLTVMLAFGLKESTRFNSVFTGINLLVVVFVVICGAFHIDLHNWNLPASQVPEYAGKGGFFPFGVSGMITGAAECFYAFIGFDVIATTGEEVKNAKKSIPISIVLSLLVAFLAYFGVSAIETLMVPYYLQNVRAPLPFVFEQVGWTTAKWVINIGALTALSTSLLGALFPLPRILYAMANDGLIFRSLSNINDRFKTPILATISSGVFAGLMALLFDVGELMEMMSIGTLLAYSLVALSILLIRYNKDLDYNSTADVTSDGSSVEAAIEGLQDKNENPARLVIETESNLLSVKKSPTVDEINSSLKMTSFFTHVFNRNKTELSTQFSSRIALSLIFFSCFLVIVLDIMLAVLENYLLDLNVFAILSVAVLLILLLIALFALNEQPINTRPISFQVPFVPYLPMLSIAINVRLMLQLKAYTWYRFVIWMAIGLAIYFCYGIRNSSERNNKKASKNIILTEKM